MLPSRLLILLYLLLGTVALSEQTAQEPKESRPQMPSGAAIPVRAPQAQRPAKEPASADVPSAQTDSKVSTADVIALAHTVVATADDHISTVEHIAEILAIMMGIVGATNLFFAVRYGEKERGLRKQLQNLEEVRRATNAELDKLGQEKDRFSNEIAELREQEGSLRGALEKVSKDVTVLREQEETLRKSSETVLKDVAELKEQEKSFRKLTEAVQKATLGRSRLSAETRLRSLQQLSQHVDPLGIAPLIEVLTDSANDIRLRLEAAYGLGRYSENSAFREYYPEILSGFREVLSDESTPRALAVDTIRSARRFGPIPDELASQIERREQSDAQSDTAES
jgi:CII-binding regulator of phage lambda lysogenization HflD